MTRRWMSAIMSGLVFAAACSTGCDVDLAGQTLPSTGFMRDDIQYFAPGPEAKLSHEAAAMKTYRADQALQDQGP